MRKLMAVLAHPDDESMGFGGTLAKYAAEGVETAVVCATRGDAGRYMGHPQGDAAHPGAARLAEIRAQELRDASKVLGVRDVVLLDYRDQQLDRADAAEIVPRLAAHVRRFRPDVLMTFGPDGGYGHPDHIAISQFATAAVVAAASAADGPAHAVAKLYYLAWPTSAWEAFEAAFRRLVSAVDGQERQARPWPDWAITTVIDTRAVWETAWQAVSCHQSQVTAYARLRDLAAEHLEALWGWQSFYRAYSTVNGGRTRETDLFEGLPR